MQVSSRFQDNSFGFFPTVRNYQAASHAAGRLVESAEQNADHVIWREIPELKSWFDKFYAWFWVWSPRYDVRIIVEVRENNELILIATLPKAWAQENILSLWKNNRTRRRTG